MDKNSGFLGITLLLVVGVMAFVLVGGTGLKYKSPKTIHDPNAQVSIFCISPSSKKGALQISTCKINVITPTQSSSPPLRYNPQVPTPTFEFQPPEIPLDPSPNQLLPPEGNNPPPERPPDDGPPAIDPLPPVEPQPEGAL